MTEKMDFWKACESFDRTMDIARCGYTRDDKRAACELLGLGLGCRDGGCDLAGPGTTRAAQHTNGGCHCLLDMPDGTRRKPAERRALQAAIAAAAKALRESQAP